jgi:hypothetical protein
VAGRGAPVPPTHEILLLSWPILIKVLICNCMTTFETLCVGRELGEPWVSFGVSGYGWGYVT